MSQDDNSSHSTTILDEMGFYMTAKSKLRSHLSKPRKVNTLCTAIRKFQSDNEVNMKHLGSALYLLDNQKVPRAELYDSCVSKLSDKIVERMIDIKDSSSDKLRSMLDRYFYTYRVPQFRKIVVKLIEVNSENLDEKYIQVICKTEELYKNCNIDVKRACWRYNDDLFVEEIRPIVNDYLRNKEDIICGIDQNPTNFFTRETTKSRRNWKQVQDIMTLIGKNENLYEKVMKYIRTMFSEVGNIHLCSLKTEIIMSWRETGSESIQKRDTIHNFAWCLDACVRDKKLDSTNLAKIKAVIDEISSKSDIDELIDFSMVAADLHVVYFFALALQRRFRDSSILPRNNTNIQIISRVLMIAANVKRMSVTRQKPTKETFDVAFITEFLPMFSGMLTEDNMRLELAKREYEGKTDEEYISDQFSGHPSEEMIQFLENNSTAALLWTIHCVTVLPLTKGSHDSRGVLRYFSALPSALKTLASRGCWTHLICHMIIVSNQFESLLSHNQQFHQIVMDNILHDNLMIDESMKYQVLKLINQVGFIWGVPRCLQMMEMIQPGSENICIGSAHDSHRFRQFFQRVTEKLQPKTSLSPPKLPFGSPPPFGSPF